MKTTYEFIQFVEIECKTKTKVWSCQNKRHGEELGQVKWFGPWRQYCYFPIVRAVYSRGCLADIAAFLEQVNAGKGDAPDTA